MTKAIGEMGKRLNVGLSKADANNFVPTDARRENNWNQNRASMSKGSFSGIGGMYSLGILLQDQAALESLGTIADRTFEQIGPADHAIVKGRQVYLDAVRAHMAGRPALGIDQDLSLVGRGNGAECERAG